MSTTPVFIIYLLLVVMALLNTLFACGGGLAVLVLGYATAFFTVLLATFFLVGHLLEKEREK